MLSLPGSPLEARWGWMALSLRLGHYPWNCNAFKAANRFFEEMLIQEKDDAKKTNAPSDRAGKHGCIE